MATQTIFDLTTIPKINIFIKSVQTGEINDKIIESSIRQLEREIRTTVRFRYGITDGTPQANGLDIKIQALTDKLMLIHVISNANRARKSLAQFRLHAEEFRSKVSRMLEDSGNKIVASLSSDRLTLTDNFLTEIENSLQENPEFDTMKMDIASLLGLIQYTVKAI